MKRILNALKKMRDILWHFGCAALGMSRTEIIISKIAFIFTVVIIVSCLVLPQIISITKTERTVIYAMSFPFLIILAMIYSAFEERYAELVDKLRISGLSQNEYARVSSLVILAAKTDRRTLYLIIERADENSELRDAALDYLFLLDNHKPSVTSKKIRHEKSSGKKKYYTEAEILDSIK